MWSKEITAVASAGAVVVTVAKGAHLSGDMMPPGASVDPGRLLRALDVAEVGTFDIDAGEDDVPAVTDGLKAMFGFDPQTSPRVQDFLARVHPADQSLLEPVVRGRLDPEVTHDLEFRVERADGTQAWLAARVQIVREPGSGRVRLLGAVSDVSTRKAAEARLQDSYALLRLATDASGAGWNAWDLPTGTTVWDARGREIMGFGDDSEGRAAAATIDGWRSRIHPDDIADLDDRIRRSLTEGADFSAQYRIVHPDGRVRVVVSVGRFGIDGGVAVRGSGLTFDVTEQTNTQVALAESERFLRRLLDNLVAFVGVLSPDGTLTQIDARALSISGLRAEDVVGRMFWECPWWTHSPEVSARIRDAVERAAGGEAVRHDTVARIADNGRLHLDLLVSPLRDDSGRITHLVPSALDITERKRAEDVLRAKEAAERRDRQRAELVAEMLSDLDGVQTLSGRARRLVELLTDRVVRWAEVSVDDDVIAAVGPTPQDPALRIDLDLGGSVDGCLSVDVGVGVRGDGGPPPGSEIAGDIDLVRDLAARAAVLLAGARVREAEQRIAIRLQRALLPDALEQHPEVAVAAIYEAAGEVLEVGGDWYDSWLTPDGKLGLSVGDVVGHGLESAAAMGRLRAAITALGGEGFGPAQLLDSLDRVAGAGGGGGVPFATAACTVLDPATGELRHACAGHPPPLVVAPDGATTWLEGGRSGPLTAPRRAGRSEAVTMMAPGSLLVMYSDGLVERRGESIREGLERLRTVAAALAGAPPEDACAALLAAVAGGAALRDDVVVLCARLTG